MQRVVLKDGEECGEWTLNGEATTYDPCSPSLEGMKKTPLFALVPFLSGCGLVFVHGPPSKASSHTQLSSTVLRVQCGDPG